MKGHNRVKHTALIGFITLVLSAPTVFAADRTDTVAQQHDAAAAALEKTARHHRAAAQHHRVGEHGIANAHAKEAEKSSAGAHEKTKTATTGSDDAGYLASPSKEGLR